MKIEILEQMFHSYLKNCEGCAIVQTNWSPAPLLLDSVTPSEQQMVRDVMQDIRGSLPFNIFKKGDAAQFLKQAEIDVAGIRFDGTKRIVYLYDTAFHEGNLSYKSGTVESVLKKLVRAAIIGSLFFKGCEVRAGFLSPKCSKGDNQKISGALGPIDAVLKRYGIIAKFEVYFDNQFDDIAEKLIALKDRIKDDNDLFMRAVKLMNLSQTPKKQITQSPATAPAAVGTKSIIIAAVEDLIARSKISPQLLLDLCDKAQAKTMFGLSGFPVMKKAGDILPKETNRYYPNIFIISGTAYRVTSQWKGDNSQRFAKWSSSL